jgi:hypothetical protein
VVPAGHEADAESVWVVLGLELTADDTIDVPDRPPAIP